ARVIANGQVIDLEGFRAGLPAKGGARDRLQTADRLDPQKLEVFAQVIIEREDLDGITCEKGSRLLLLDDQGDRGRRMGGRDRTYEHRRRHANRRSDANGGVDGTVDGSQQRSEEHTSE